MQFLSVHLLAQQQTLTFTHTCLIQLQWVILYDFVGSQILKQY